MLISALPLVPAYTSIILIKYQSIKIQKIPGFHAWQAMHLLASFSLRSMHR